MDEGACHACGRAAHHWADREPGTKKDQLPGDDENKAAKYIEWHRKLGSHLLAMDIDQVEYRIVDGTTVPVAFIELTRISGKPNPPPSYFEAIITRALERDAQISTLRILARRCRVSLYYVAYMPDGSEFHVADLLDGTDRPRWKRLSQPEYRMFLNSMRPIEVTEESPMTDRLTDDEEKLREAVGIFRTQANLHASSSDDALVRYAHEAGKGKPHASMVREAWHDFENGRRYASLRVLPYVIKYQTQEQMFEPTPTDVEQALAALDRSEPKVEDVRDDRLSSRQRWEGGVAGPEPAHSLPDQNGDAGESHEQSGKAPHVGGDDPASPCPHIDMVLDEKGEVNVCADCGELLGPANPDPIRSQGDAAGSDEGKGKVATSDASGTASGPKRIERSKQPKPTDDEEVLF